MKWKRLKAFALWLTTISGLTVALTVNVTINRYAPPLDPDALGWRPDLVADAREEVAAMPAFRIVGDDQDHSRDNVRLWEFAKRINGGEHLPTPRQAVGDCVSFGAAAAVNYLQAVQLSQRDNPFLDLIQPRPPPSKEFRPVFPPYIYGTSRVQIGKGRIKGDGSVGAWAARAVQEFGVLSSNADGVPAYSAAIARNWGRSGPPEKFIEQARRFPVRTVAPVRTPDAVRSAICNGYPVTIASDFGTKSYQVRDGRQVAKGDAKWMHQMAIIAADGSGREPYFYVINSWGPHAHPKPLQGEPPGGFWITEPQLERILAFGDSFAWSAFEGFPNRLDFNVFGQAAPAPAALDLAQAQLENHRGELIVLGLLVAVLGLLGLNRPRLVFGYPAALAASLGAVLACSSAPAAPLDFSILTGPEPELDFSVLVGPPTAAPLDFQALATPPEPAPALDFEALARRQPPAAAAHDARHIVKFYAPTWCEFCRNKPAQIGDGDDELAIDWITDPDVPLPPGLTEVPAAGWTDGRGNTIYAYKLTSFDQLKALYFQSQRDPP